MEEQIRTKTKSKDEHFKEMVDRCIARWEIGKNMTVGELRSKALKESANSEPSKHSWAVQYFCNFWADHQYELRVGKPCSKGLIASEYVTSGPGMLYFSKWIDVYLTAAAFYAQQGDSATAAKISLLVEILIATKLRQFIT